MKLHKWFYGALLAEAGMPMDTDDSKRVQDGYNAQLDSQDDWEPEPPVSEYIVEKVSPAPTLILNGVANILNLWRLSILKQEDAVRIIHDMTKE